MFSRTSVHILKFIYLLVLSFMFVSFITSIQIYQLERYEASCTAANVACNSLLLKSNQNKSANYWQKSNSDRPVASIINQHIWPKWSSCKRKSTSDIIRLKWYFPMYLKKRTERYRLHYVNIWVIRTDWWLFYKINYKKFNQESVPLTGVSLWKIELNVSDLTTKHL